MDPYETEEFFKLSEPQRSQLLYVRIKHLEQEVANLKTFRFIEGRGGGILEEQNSGGIHPDYYSERTDEVVATELRENDRKCYGSVQRERAPFSLATGRSEQDFHFGEEMSSFKTVANDRPLYLQKLLEVDNMCKEEMAKVNAVRENLEPLKQLSFDWQIEEAVDNSRGIATGRLERNQNKTLSDDFLRTLSIKSKVESTNDISKSRVLTFGSPRRR